MIKVNLVPQEILDKETQRQRMMQVGVVAAFVGVLLIGVSFTHYRKKTVLDAQLVEENKTLKRFQAIVDQVNQFEAQAAAVRARLNVMNDLIKGRELYPVFMVDIVESFPEGVWIGSLSTVKGKGGLNLTMPAFATSTRDVTNWLRTLESSPLFSEAVISPISIAADGQHTFSMKMTYSPPAEGAAKGGAK